MQRCLVLLLSLVLSLTAVAAQTAQLSVNFMYQAYSASVGAYPSVCTNGTLLCTENNTTFTCSAASGQHVYYPSTTAPSFVSALSPSLPATCEGYTADQQLPITGNGLNLQYNNASCINIYLSSATTGAIQVSPDAVSGPATFNYSLTTPFSCPAPIAPTASGTATVGFLYSVSNSSATVCAAGTLNCNQYGNNEYVCSGLNSGSRYVYYAANNSIASSSLGALGECNSWGDGYLPLDYEGLSFSTAQGCVSVYSKNGTALVKYEQAYASSATFSYGVNTISSPSSACTNYIPGLSSTPSNGADSRLSFSATALVLALMLAGVSLLL